jgi:hypothetical protein
MREKLVTELVKEILGPRNGVNEILHESPLGEYITGVLAPIMERRERPVLDIDESAELPVEDTASYEDETADVDVSVPFFYPALDPKRRPSTMGLSFVVRAEGIPEISVCITWASYHFLKEEKIWIREPHYAVFSIRLDSNITYWIDGNGQQTGSSEQAAISFHTVIRPLHDDRRLVNLYLVNRIKPPVNREPASEHHIFQPQIRVVLEKGTRLVPREHIAQMSKEEKRLEFLFRERAVLARGHLCSAIWKEIDPEANAFDINLDFPSCRNESPFGWVDGILLPEEERKRFSPPDVRTEFVPAYSIPFPDLDWPEKYGKAPELNASRLAEIWHPESLKEALMPVCIGYQKWITEMEIQLENLPKNEREIAYELIEECKVVLQRIISGIDILCNDTNARLAFCFANKAIDLQWKWHRNSDFVWRPFQLAFILLTIESIANSRSDYRNTCDLLWVPTGTGKTEAYLAIVAFTLALRRRRALCGSRKGADLTGAGIAVISRYTLRLLTIQQFRRTLSLVTACEYLRILNLMQNQPIGWRPSSCNIKDSFLWGSTPFAIGLWVGGGLSPNRLEDIWVENRPIHGALSILRGEQGEGEPAQVLTCPACGSILAVPEMGLQPGEYTLYLVVNTENGEKLNNAVRGLQDHIFHGITIREAGIYPHEKSCFYTLLFRIDTQNIISSETIDGFWNSVEKYMQSIYNCGVILVSARASRPGYFIRYYVQKKMRKHEYDFEVFCPNPECPLRIPWIGGAPTGWVNGREPSLVTSPDGYHIPLFNDGNGMIEVQDPFRYGDKEYSSKYIADRIPIPALTVDDQIYRRLPSIVVATLDKLARPPFEPQAGALFGNVDHHHCVYGYYRQYQPVSPYSSEGHPSPLGTSRRRNYIRLVRKPDPPDLIIQDELHLIEGPLGSLAGIYETAVDYLCSEGGGVPKYIASTATIRRASEQVQAVFLRGLQIFPPHGLVADDCFFIRGSEAHALEEKRPGRLYLGICAPRKGPLTPLVRIYARLLHTVWRLRAISDVDSFWTLTGYFNAVRELAGARALYRQDIPQRLSQISDGNIRKLSEEGSVELSSRTPSTDLPAIIDILNRNYPDAPDILFTTSMFGTGVDIQRICLMVVNGQPKTTSAYIQSTGRVGRSRGALVVTFFRATRPRDLSHYEFFTGYHRQLHRFVEPPTVYPFSTGVLDRALGPVMVFLLRNMRNVLIPWHRDDSASCMTDSRASAPELKKLPDIISARAQRQPYFRRPANVDIIRYSEAELDRWKMKAVQNRRLKYVEYAIVTFPQSPVVLGDYQHQHAGLDVVYENAPRSLRDIEETTGFQT